MFGAFWKDRCCFFSQSTTDPEAFTNSKLFVHQKVCILLVFVITNIQICLLTGTFASSLSSFSLFACSGTQNCLWIRCFAFLTGNVPMFEHFPFKLLWNSLQRSFRWQGGGRRHCELPPISSRHKYVQTKYFSTYSKKDSNLRKLCLCFKKCF